MSHLRTGTFSAAIAVAAISLSAGASAASVQDTPNTVSRSEFNRAVNGMTALAITGLFDVPGKMISQGGGYQTRQFIGWKSGDGERYRVQISFRIGKDQRWHMTYKRAFLPSESGDVDG